MKKSGAWIVAAVAAALTSPALARRAAPAAPARDPYYELSRELDQATRVWDEFYAAARTDAERGRLVDAHPDSLYVPRFADLAAEYPGEYVALRALAFVVEHGDEAEQLYALDVLERDFLADPDLEEICASVWSLHPRAQSFLMRVLAENPYREVQGQALYSLAQIAIGKDERAAHGRNPGVEPASRAEQLLQEVIDSYGDLWHWQGSLARAAEKDLFALRELAVGKLAPDILGEDLDGELFRLSDYRGKVVVLTFWGDWSKNSRAAYAHHLLLVKRMEGKPFALIGVNSDTDRWAVNDEIRAKGLAWRSFWDGGGTGGLIATRWNVKSWPTVYVLDHEGRIRSKNVGGRNLDRVVDGLQKELQGK